jgi:hypothetical protein
MLVCGRSVFLVCTSLGGARAFAFMPSDCDLATVLTKVKIPRVDPFLLLFLGTLLWATLDVDVLDRKVLCILAKLVSIPMPICTFITVTKQHYQNRYKKGYGYPCSDTYFFLQLRRFALLTLGFMKIDH